MKYSIAKKGLQGIAHPGEKVYHETPSQRDDQEENGHEREERPHSLEPGGIHLRAAALVIRENGLLCVDIEPLGCYYTVGGGLHPMEETAAAAEREMREEAGL